jgi:hypothetical protein
VSVTVVGVTVHPIVYPPARRDQPQF